MAVIKFGSVVTSGRGSLGGSTIQPDHSGHIWRNKPFPVKSRTQAQSVIRSINKTMQAAWRNLTAQQRQIWNDYAKPELSGHSLWLKFQFHYLYNGFAIEVDPSIAEIGPLGPELFLDPDIEKPDLWSLQPGTTISWGVLYSNTGLYRIAFIPIPLLSSGLSYRFDVKFTTPYLGTMIIIRNQVTANFITGWEFGSYYVTSDRIIHDGLLFDNATGIYLVSENPRLGYNINHISIKQLY